MIIYLPEIIVNKKVGNGCIVLQLLDCQLVVGENSERCEDQSMKFSAAMKLLVVVLCSQLLQAVSISLTEIWTTKTFF